MELSVQCKHAAQRVSSIQPRQQQKQQQPLGLAEHTEKGMYHELLLADAAYLALPAPHAVRSYPAFGSPLALSPWQQANNSTVDYTVWHSEHVRDKALAQH